MGDSMSAYYEDISDYNILCKLVNEQPRDDMYQHLGELKKDNRIVYRNYTYILRDNNEQKEYTRE